MSKSLRGGLSPAVAYAASVVIDKGFSVLTIPLVASYLAPSEYGRLDVAVSLIEFCGIILAVGAGDTLVRFGSSPADGANQKRTAANLFGAITLIALAGGGLLQLAAPYLAQALGIGIGITALRWGLAGAALTALIDLPLVWLRMRGRVEFFLCFVAIRSALQVAVMFLALRSGWGADGMLIANGTTLSLIASLLVAAQLRSSGIALSWISVRQLGAYGVPLIGSAVAMFALGSCNRWFLSGAVPDAEIAALSLATKLALATPLLLQPFLLWWNPRRIGILSKPTGLAESRWAWGLGYSVLLLSAMGIALAAPLFITLFLPSSYAGAIAFVPFVIVVCFLNELNTLTNVGAYARSDGLGVLAVNLSGASLSVLGYLLLTHPFGVYGVLAAMIAGHVLRLALFLWIGRSVAPIDYPYISAVVSFLLAAGSVGWAPDAAQATFRIVWSVLATAAVTTALLHTRLLVIDQRVAVTRTKWLSHAPT